MRLTELIADARFECTLPAPLDLMALSVEQTAKALTAKLEEEIRLALDRFWPQGWTKEDVAQRCCIVRRFGDPIETFTADGVALLEIHPIRTETEVTPTSHRQVFTRLVKRLRHDC